MTTTVTYDYHKQRQALEERRALDQLRNRVNALDAEKTRLSARLENITKRLAEARSAEKVRVSKEKVRRWKHENDYPEACSDENDVPCENVGYGLAVEVTDTSPQISEATLIDHASAVAECGFDYAAKNSKGYVKLLTSFYILLSCGHWLNRAQDDGVIIKPEYLECGKHQSGVPLGPVTNTFEDDATALAILYHWDEFLSNGNVKRKSVTMKTGDLNSRPLARSDSLAQLKRWGSLAQKRRLRPVAMAV